MRETKTSQQREWETEIREHLEYVGAIFGHHEDVNVDRWTFRWTQSVRTFGCAAGYPATIEFSEVHWPHLSAEERRIVVLHEAAHIVAGNVYGREVGKGHGMAWKQAMRMLGLEPNRFMVKGAGDRAALQVQRDRRMERRTERRRKAALEVNREAEAEERLLRAIFGPL